MFAPGPKGDPRKKPILQVVAVFWVRELALEPAGRRKPSSKPTTLQFWTVTPVVLARVIPTLPTTVEPGPVIVKPAQSSVTLFAAIVT